MIRSDSVMVWSHLLPTKSLLVGGEWWWWWQTKFSVSPGPGLWTLVLGPFGPDLGPDLDLTWDLELDNIYFDNKYLDFYFIGHCEHIWQ